MDDKEVEMILSQPDVMVGSDSMSLAIEGLLAKTVLIQEHLVHKLKFYLNM